MPELSIDAVIRCLPMSELEEAVESALDKSEPGDLVWSIMDEIERRNPRFEI